MTKDSLESLYTRAEYRREELNQVRELQGLAALRLTDVLRQWYSREVERLQEAR